MKITFEKSDVLPALLRASSVAPSKSTLPIISNVIISVSGNKATITGSDLETTLSARADVDGDGVQFCVSAKKLCDVIKALPDGKVTIEVKDKAIIKSGRSRFTIALTEPDQYPANELMEMPIRVPVNGAVLSALLSSVDFASGDNDVRYYLNGCLLTMDGEYLAAVASDGHRLCRNRIHVGNIEQFAAILPNNGVAAIKKTLASSEGIILEAGERAVSVATNTESLTTKLVVGKYPDIDRVIPKQFKTEVEVNRSDLIGSIKRALIVAEDRAPALIVTFGSESLDIKSRNGLDEEAAESVDVITAFGVDDSQVWFNGKYMLDALSAIKCENVNILISDNGVITLKEEENTDWISIIMPMRV